MATFPIPQQPSTQSQPNSNFIFQGDHYNPNISVEPPQSAQEEGRGTTTVPNLSYYLPLYQAARDGDWKKGKQFIDENPDSVTAVISIHGATALHIAASYGRSEFVEKIVKLMPSDALEMRDGSGCTALHCIAVRGTVKAATALVERSPYLAEMVNDKNDTPLYHLCTTMPLVSATEREMVWYLCYVTRDVCPSFCFSGGGAPNLIVKLIAAGHLDICLNLFKRYPGLATSAIREKGGDLIIGLCAATSEFPSGNTLSFFENFIYKIVPSQPSHEQEPVPPPSQPDGSHLDSQHVTQMPFSMQPRMPSNPVIPSELLYEQELVSVYVKNSPLFISTPDNCLNLDAQQARQQSFLNRQISCFGQVIIWLIKVLCAPIKIFCAHVIALLSIIVRSFRRARDMKRRHYHSSALLHYICKLVIQQNTVDLLSLFQERYVLHTAAERGIVEIVAVFFRYIPTIMLSKDSKTLLHVAVENRRAEIFNLLMELHATTNSFLFTKLESGENVLHLAARLAPSLQLNSVSGPALHMQRELQWFKEVEKLFNNTDKILKNKDGKTPRELFTIEHKELKTKGEQWMRDTSNSCMVVTTLIATIAFAAIFTVPGGINDDDDDKKGTPLLLHKASFIVFAIADGLALFSSVTSLIMFLSILTARYGEEDFLISLPRKLIIGLSSLFVAIASTMIAFGAGLSIMLRQRLTWIYTPVILFGGFPVALFGMLQLPLLVQMIRSTFGRSIFYRPGDYYYRNLAYMKLR